MADRPILFSAPMIRALLAGTKTQTRRVHFTQSPEFRRICDHGCSERLVSMCISPSCNRRTVTDAKVHVGDRLWVRETWSGVHEFRDTPPAQRYSFTTPDGPVIREDVHFWADGKPLSGDYEKPRPGIHMPRWASRLTLAVTDVRVQRLHNISEEDAIAEGVPSDDDYAGSFAKEYCHHCGGSGLHGAFGAGYGVTEVECAECYTPQLRYRNLWNHINGDGAWDENPWVVCYSFTVHHGNIDEIAQVAA